MDKSAEPWSGVSRNQPIPYNEAAVGEMICLNFLAGEDIRDCLGAMYERACEKGEHKVVTCTMNGFKFTMENLER